MRNYDERHNFLKVFRSRRSSYLFFFSFSFLFCFLPLHVPLDAIYILFVLFSFPLRFDQKKFRADRGRWIKVGVYANKQARVFVFLVGTRSRELSEVACVCPGLVCLVSKAHVLSRERARRRHCPYSFTRSGIQAYSSVTKVHAPCSLARSIWRVPMNPVDNNH